MESRSKNNISDLMTASSRGETSRVRALLEGGAQADARDIFGNTALIYAAAGGHLEVVKLLLKYGASVDLKNQVGLTASMRAAANGFTRVVELLERKQGLGEQP